MNRVYRVLAAALIVIGILVMYWTISATISDVMHTYNPNPIRCDSRGCRTILDDGTLADDEVARPEGTR